MADCMECIHFNPCNLHGKIIIEKPTDGNDWGLHNKVENECKYFTPTADVVEVKHGYDTGNANIFECSVCGYGVDDIYEADEKNYPVWKFNYCPHCGAKMDGGKAE